MKAKDIFEVGKVYKYKFAEIPNIINIDCIIGITADRTLFELQELNTNSKSVVYLNTDEKIANYEKLADTMHAFKQKYPELII